jgi:hypothetical protein
MLPEAYQLAPLATESIVRKITMRKSPLVEVDIILT